MSLVQQTLLPLLGQSLELASLRQSVHAANIANATVPGYRRVEVQFDHVLGSLQSTQARVVVAPGDATVHLDREVALMARDAVHYQAVIGALQREAGLLRMAIWEGKGG